MRAPRIAVAVLAGHAIVLCAVFLGVERWCAIDARPPLGDDQRRELFVRLRAELEGRPPPSLVARTAWRARVAVYCPGAAEPAASSMIEARAGEPLPPSDIAAALADRRARGALTGCRLKLDLITGTAPIVTSIEPLFALSLIPGIDGLGVRFGDREALVTPDDLMRADLLSGYRPIPSLDFDTGLDTHGALRLLALSVGASADAWRRTPHQVFRFRVESWIEPAGRAGDALPVVRGNVPGPALSAAALREAARAGARYLVRHLHDDGRFDYQYDTIVDQDIPDDADYSIPRHAGAAWFLAQAGGALPGERFDEASARALGWLVAHRPEGCDRPDRACAGGAEDTTVDLGSSSLALLAATEYRARTGDARFAPWAARLAAFIAAMQKPDGDFAHLYDLAADRRDDRTRLLYYSGEAAFALARHAALVGDRALAERVGRALDYLTGPAYGYFAGNFYYGEDHWTCLAVDAAWELLPASRRDSWADFCDGFARFIRRSQFRAGEGPTRDQPDLVGAYGFSPLIAPHPTPVGSRSEALLAILSVAERRGRGDTVRDVTAALTDSMRFLLDHQITADSAWLMPRPEAAVGGFLQSDLKRQVRIDFIQHACSAMLRFAARLDAPARVR